MTNRKRTHSGKGILIVVVLGPLCAAAADLPGRALATPAEPVANLPIQSFQHGKVVAGAAATIANRASAQKKRNSERTVIAIVESSQPTRQLFGPDLIPASDRGNISRLYWLDNPTSTGP